MGRPFGRALAKIVALLAALKPETRKKLAKSKVELKKTLRLLPSESKRLGNSPVVGGQTSSPVVEDTATIHEFVHELFDNAGISTDEYSAKDLDDKAKALRPQVDELEKRDPKWPRSGRIRFEPARARRLIALDRQPPQREVADQRKRPSCIPVVQMTTPPRFAPIPTAQTDTH